MGSTPPPLGDLYCPTCGRETTHEVMTRWQLRCVVCGREKHSAPHHPPASRG